MTRTATSRTTLMGRWFWWITVGLITTAPAQTAGAWVLGASSTALSQASEGAGHAVFAAPRFADEAWPAPQLGGEREACIGGSLNGQNLRIRKPALAARLACSGGCGGRGLVTSEPG